MRRDFAFKVRKRHFKKYTGQFFDFLWRNPKKVIVFLAVTFVAFPFILISIVTRELPTPENILSKAKYSTTILDRKDRVIYQVFDEKNIVPVKYSELPKYVGQATVSVEDKNFFEHKGYSLVGILRGLIKTVVFHQVEGGSTLTQQLVKNNLLSSERTLTRKFKELILAIELERRYSKEQILEMYLNLTPYGGTAWGIESASQLYFGKHAAELSLLEASVLAGFPQSPSYYSPYVGDSKAYINRTKQVLRRMREDKYITKKQEEVMVSNLPFVKFKKNNSTVPAPHFVFYVKALLDEMVANDALFKKGMVIKTTLDLDLQKKAEQVVREEIKLTKGLDISNAAAVVIDPKSGDILAMVGSVDYNNDVFGKFNAALGFRQPGSTLKPFTYALAFENGQTPSTMLMDTETEFTTGKETSPPYKPVNYDAKYRGPVQIRYALGSSLNVPAVKVLSQVGLQNLMQVLYDSGLETLEPTEENMKQFGLSLTLGGGEVRLVDLVQAYGVLANQGETTNFSAIREVRDYKNKLIFKAKPKPSKRIFSKETAFLVSHILSDNNARLLTFGSNNYLNVNGYTVAAKTGTTDDKRDNWTLGYTNDLVIGVWVGNNDNSPMNEALSSGVSGAAPIWRRIMLEAFKEGYKDGIMNKPDKVVALEVDALFGMLPHGGDAKRSEYFLEGTEPKEVSPFYKTLKISKSNQKLANPTEVANGNFEEKEFYVVHEEDPLSLDGKNRWQESIDAWARGQGDEKWKPPGETSDADADAISIKVQEPGDKSKLSGNDIRFFARVYSSSKVKRFQLYIDDSLREETTADVLDRNIHLDDGTYRIKFVAANEKDKSTETTLRIGVNREVKDDPTPTPTPKE